MGTKKKATITVDVPANADELGVEVLMVGQFAKKVAQLDTLAQHGYVEAARARVGLFAKYLRSGHPMPTDEFLRLCGWLEKIEAGDDPRDVFEVKKKTRGPAPDMKRLERLERVASHVWYLTNGGRALNDSKNGDGAISQAAAEHKVSESEARLAWEVFGEGLKELSTKGKQGPPIIKPLKTKRKK